MTPLEILKGARAKLALGFIHDTFARTASGERVDCNDPTATCFCAIGAMAATVHSTPDRILWTSFDHRNFNLAKGVLRKAIYEEFIVNWNDRSDQATVLAGFDRAISFLEDTNEHA